MRLEQGEILGHFKIQSMIGRGGMGEVYRALDVKLEREVAIKVLPVPVANDRERLARCEREAKVLAQLNHHGIASIYGVEDRALVMELVPGPTLADRLKQGPIPPPETQKILLQIAEALEYAHEKGIVHRDLKPANIKIDPDDNVKILDFGLARAFSDPMAGAADDPADSPTVTLDATAPGIILGTAAYMAPEQARGKKVDKRADIWAFGVVAWEMLTGERLFRGEDTAQILGKVLEQPLTFDRVPGRFRKLLARCLDRNVKDRLRDIGEARFLLADREGEGGADVTNRIWVRSAMLVIIVAGAALALWAPWREPATTQVVGFEVGPSEKVKFVDKTDMAVSPDGRWLVFPAQGDDGAYRYYLRSVSNPEVRALPGTEGAQTPPAAWSYDSRWVLFSNTPGSTKLKKVDIYGGPAQDVAIFPGNLGGGDWNSDGVIIAGAASSNSPIVKVAASGGSLTPTPVTTLSEGITAHRWPQFLPDGKHFLYMRVSSNPEQQGVYIGSIDVPPQQQSGERLLPIDSQAYYARLPGGSSGHLIFMRGTTLMAQPFDPSKGKLQGEPIAIADGVDSFAGSRHGLFTVSNNGTLVYRRGSGAQTTLAWFDPQGNPAGTFGEIGEYMFPAVSPDGARVAVAMSQSGTRSVWIQDVARGSAARFTFGSTDDSDPVWSPDGKYIAFSSSRGGQRDIYVKPADNSGEEKLLLKTDESKTPTQWTKDGRFLVFSSAGPKTTDLWALPYPGEPKPVLLLKTQFRETEPRVSPDGRWLAYTSNKSGTPGVYVRPFTPEAPSGTGAEWLVSQGIANARPLWSPDSKHLYYLIGGGFQVAVVDINTAGGFQASSPRRIFTAPSTGNSLGWDLSPDGKRFLFAAPPNNGRAIPFTVVLNWAAELKK